MAGAHSKKNRRSGNRMARRGLIGLGGGAGAFLALGLAPLANVPHAKADVLDAILDPLINSLGSVDPTLAVDLGSLVASFDPTFSDAGLAALSASDAALPAADAAQVSDLTQLINTEFYQPAEQAGQAWINSSTGEAFDNSLNTFWQDIGGQGILIGNGADGVGGGSLAEATGGAGATDAAGQGGAGGLAYFGDGGDGGAGADGGAGGAGGDTGLGIGGDGGTGGAGSFADGGDGNGGAGGAGGDATAFCFGIGGDGGDGGGGGAGGEG